MDDCQGSVAIPCHYLLIGGHIKRNNLKLGWHVLKHEECGHELNILTSMSLVSLITSYQRRVSCNHWKRLNNLVFVCALRVFFVLNKTYDMLGCRANNVIGLNEIHYLFFLSKNFYSTKCSSIAYLYSFDIVVDVPCVEFFVLVIILFCQ